MPFTSALPGRLNATSRAGLGHRPRGQRSTGRRRQPLPRPWAPSRSRPRPPPPRSSGAAPRPGPALPPHGAASAGRGRPAPGHGPGPEMAAGIGSGHRGQRFSLQGCSAPRNASSFPGLTALTRPNAPCQLQHSTLCLNVLMPDLRGLTALGVPQHPPGAATKRPHPSLCHCIPPACGVHWCHEKSRLHRPAHPSYVFQAAASTLAPSCLLSLHYLSSKATEK